MPIQCQAAAACVNPWCASFVVRMPAALHQLTHGSALQLNIENTPLAHRKRASASTAKPTASPFPFATTGANREGPSIKAPALPASALTPIVEEDSWLESQQPSAAVAQPPLLALDDSKRLKQGLTKAGASMAAVQLDHAVIDKDNLAAKATSNDAPAPQARSGLQTYSPQALAKSAFQGKEGKALPGPSSPQAPADSRAATASAKAGFVKGAQSHSHSGKTVGSSAVPPMPGKKTASSADSESRQGATEAKTAKGLPALSLSTKAHSNAKASQAKLTSAASLDKTLIRSGSKEAAAAEAPRHKMVGPLSTLLSWNLMLCSPCMRERGL